MNLNRTALDLLKETSRTFYIPISRLPSGLQEAVASAYLCMRAIDQIEDHPTLDNAVKARMLQQISLVLQAGERRFTAEDFRPIFEPQFADLEEVTLRLDEWLSYAPAEIAPRIWEAISTMSDRMAHWAECNWSIETEAELNQLMVVRSILNDLGGSDTIATGSGDKTLIGGMGADQITAFNGDHFVFGDSGSMNYDSAAENGVLRP